MSCTEAPATADGRGGRTGPQALSVTPRQVTLVLGTAAAVIVAYGLITRVLAEPFPQPFEELSRLGDERRLPSWFQSGSLLLAAGLCVACAGVSQVSAVRWKILAAIVALASVEETAGVHRAFRQQLAGTPGNGAVVDYAAIALLVGLLAAGARSMVGELAPATRRLLLRCVATYVTALLLDAAGHAITDRSLADDLLGMLEEGLESGAVVLLAAALVSQLTGAILTVAPGPET
ncbi:MAG: hypothetical protein QOE86_764 [Solirubrobacteraceae bacterium]|nr:hypothetical protein [Solirubrobacteraceae bacterium]